MTSQNSTNPFLSLDKTCFRKERENRKTPPTPSLPVASSMSDESALFLATMATVVPQSKNASAPSAVEEDDFALLLESEKPRGKTATHVRTSVWKTEMASSPDDTHLFAKAMDDVAPLRSRGREVPPPVKAPTPTRTVPVVENFSSSSITFSLEYTEEYLQGHILGLAPVILSKLRAGSFSHEGHVDLHGHNMEQAYAQLVLFIKHAYQNGKRHLIVVTGRGKNSPNGTGVLRERVHAWFTRDPFKRVVLAFCSAKLGDGGAGALYVLLRKRKKSQGKIVWDKFPGEEDLLI